MRRVTCGLPTARPRISANPRSAGSVQPGTGCITAVVGSFTARDNARNAMSDSCRSPKPEILLEGALDTHRDGVAQRAGRGGGTSVASTGVPGTTKSPIRGASRSATRCRRAARTRRAMFMSRSTPARPGWTMCAVSGPSAAGSPAAMRAGIRVTTRNDSEMIRSITLPASLR